MNMISPMGTTQNQPLTPSVRDNHWVDSLAFASSLSDDTMTCTRHKKSNKKQLRRSPHKLRLDEQRVVVSFCDLHSIPEDEPLCQYRHVLLERTAIPSDVNGEEEEEGAPHLIQLQLTLFQN